jgi:ferric-chelate reductase
VYGFWGGILLIGIINRLVHYLLSLWNVGASPDKEYTIEAQSNPRNPSTAYSKIYHWVQTNFIIPPVFGSHYRRRLFSFTVPTRAETLVILAYYIYSIVACAVSYEVFYPNL